jgi:hypothetical protein
MNTGHDAPDRRDELGEEAFEPRRRELAARCAALLGGAVATLALVLAALVREPGELTFETPTTVGFALAVGALVLVLLASAARAGILRRAREREADGEPPSGSPILAVRFAVFERATLVCFAMLAVAAGCGLVAALAGRAPFYGLTVGAASTLGMAVRWPRRPVLEEWLRGPDPEEGAP